MIPPSVILEGLPDLSRRDNSLARRRRFARLKQFRAVATRFDKLAARYRAGVLIASLVLWLRDATA